MSYKILEQNGVDNENIDGGAFNNFSAGNRDGIIGGVLSECAVTATGNSIGISPGELIIHGIRVKLISVETLTLASAPSEPIRYQIIAQIELKADKSIAFSLFVQEVADLIQEELYASDLGTYQVEVARFTHGSNGNIEDLSKTLDIIYGGTGGGGDFEIGNVTSNVIDATLPAEAEVNKRIEGGKTYIDFEFYFPDTQETMQAAVSAKNAAEAAQAGAEAAQSAAETAEDNAKASETAAQGYANAASGSAGQAATSAGQAQASAEQAAGSASAAGQSASAAAGSASQAAQSAGAAAGSAGDAADSALAAQGYMEQAKEYAQKEYKIYDSFDDLPVPGDSAFIYLVPSSSATGDDSYAEYLWISEDNKYEYIGSVNDIDLSNYAQVSGTYPNMTVGNATNATNAANAENANNAASANKVANALTVVVDGESTVYDGSAARTVDINTTSSTDPEAVHFTEQALTSEQQTQARENIRAAGTRGTYPDLTAGKAISDAAGNDISDTYAKQSDISNPNLIINPDFKINQRNKRNTDIGSQSYGADRWKQLNSNGVVFTSDDFLQITGDTPATNLSQPFEEIPPAGDYTLSVMSGSSKTNLSVKSMNFTITDNGELQINSIISLGVGMYLLSVYITDGVFDVRFTCLGNSGTCYVKWVKLEKGSVATMFVPPNITTELLKCQRYYMTYKANWVPCAIDTTGASASVPIPFATQMRAIPTITSKSNTGWIRANTTRVNITISSVTIAEAAVDVGRAVYAFTPVTDAIKYSAGYISSVDIALDAEI